MFLINLGFISLPALIQSVPSCIHLTSQSKKPAFNTKISQNIRYPKVHRKFNEGTKKENNSTSNSKKKTQRLNSVVNTVNQAIVESSQKQLNFDNFFFKFSVFLYYSISKTFQRGEILWRMDATSL